MVAIDFYIMEKYYGIQRLLQGSRVRPNFSRVRLKKIWERTCATSRSRKEKKVSATLSIPVLQHQTHIDSYRGLNQSEIVKGGPQTFVYDAFLLFPIQKRDRAHVEEFQHAQHESPVYDRREN